MRGINQHGMGLLIGKRMGLLIGKRMGLLIGKRMGLLIGKRTGFLIGKRMGLPIGKRMPVFKLKLTVHCIIQKLCVRPTFCYPTSTPLGSLGGTNIAPH